MKKLIVVFASLVAQFSAQVSAQDWKPNPKYIQTTKKPTEKKDLIQCSGTTKKGERCKRMGKANPNLKDNIFLCSQHINQQ